ncbi:hypothetical protein [Nitrosopumilus sp.]|uniref:hypothetical protein n=1 Tax=Nitrosopumilus sp. TaxID=2024843 RepID=UPI003D0C9B6C
MDFHVYDNIYKYKRMYPTTHHYPENHYPIKRIAITEENSFWFETDMKMEDHNVNVNKRYLHLHQGIKSIAKMQFDKEPRFIDTQSDVIYDPKDNCIKIFKPGRIWPWSKPIFIKGIKGRSYFTSKPLKKMKAKGEWIFDHPNQTVHIMLDYYPGNRGNHWSD